MGTDIAWLEDVVGTDLALLEDVVGADIAWLEDVVGTDLALLRRCGGGGRLHKRKGLLARLSES